MTQCRCKRCGRLLAKAKFERLEIKCPRCKTLNILKAQEPPT
ncbi:Com family DNA-binding transcriptional regulator [Methylophaga nitratireducenticrescens]|nr:Com family DNA-binding transcriptional regulator [Methylophaga nitratireducenticrescens]AUZ85777.1 Com family DNA-binding transcriptional regulator [Methylophaga nitratireducenticrescens]AUZ85833.1 Com family DNA-binding transcriptional regulator [Methylophaga nitratireducenticrescens]